MWFYTYSTLARGFEDRFLFPQDAILEVISSQHCLASFIVTKKGRDAADPTGLDPDTEYWQPVTLLIECAFQREQPMRNIIKWVKPAEEVKKHMQEIIDRCTRAPDTHLALRLPFRSAADVEGAQEGGNSAGDRNRISKIAAPQSKVAKSNLVGQKTKPNGDGSGIPNDTSAKAELVNNKPDSSQPSRDPVQSDKESQATDTGATARDPPQESNAVPAVGATNIITTEEVGGRPKRAPRKSVRIVES